MNRKLEQKIDRLAEKNGWEVLKKEYSAVIHTGSIEQCEEARKIVMKIPDTTSFLNSLKCSIEVYNRADYEEQQRSTALMFLLIDRFYEVHRETGNSDEAKDAQWILAQSIGAVREFNKIYA